MGSSNGKEKCAYELNDQNLLNAERRVLELSQIPESEIKQINVKIREFKEQDVYIRTNVCGDLTKPKLVWVHGYGSSGPLFFKVIQQLTQYFCLIFIDLLGMGGSSRPNDFDKNKMTPAEVVEYFVESIE